MEKGLVYIARHGETEWNRMGRLQGRSDIPLNDVGREQARRLGERVRELGLTHIGASSLRRAQETARICGAAVRLDVSYIDADLGERQYGAFEGLTRDELVAAHPAEFAAWKADNRVTPPGAEPYDAMVRRMLLAATRAKQHVDEQGGVMLLVSHGGAMRSLVFGATGEVVPPFANGALLALHFDAQARCIGVAPMA